MKKKIMLFLGIFIMIALVILAILLMSLVEQEEKNGLDKDKVNIDFTKEEAESTDEKDTNSSLQPVIPNLERLPEIDEDTVAKSTNNKKDIVSVEDTDDETIVPVEDTSDVHFTEETTDESGTVAVSTETRLKYREAVLKTFEDKYHTEPPKEIRIVYSTNDLAYVYWGNVNTIFNTGVLFFGNANQDVYINDSEGELLVNVYYIGETDLGYDLETNIKQYAFYLSGGYVGDTLDYYTLKKTDTGFILHNCATDEDNLITEEQINNIEIVKWSKNFETLEGNWYYNYANCLYSDLTNKYGLDIDYSTLPEASGIADDYKIYRSPTDGTLTMQVTCSSGKLAYSVWDTNKHCIDFYME